MEAGSPRSAPSGASAGLSLSFMASGCAAMLAGGIAIAAFPGLLSASRLDPAILAVVHLWFLGFLASATVGAVYQLMPVVLSSETTPGALGWVHLGLHWAGLLLLLEGFARGRFVDVAAGGGLVALGAGLLARFVAVSVLRSSRRDFVAASFVASAGWWLVTVSLGWLMAADLAFGWFPLPFLSILKGHAHAGMLGFFLSLIQGVAFELVPMFTLAEVRRRRMARDGFVLGQAGLATLCVGFVLEITPIARLGSLLVLLSLLWTASALAATWLGRRRRRHELDLTLFGIGGLLALVACLGGISLLYAKPSEAAERGIMAYGLVAGVGALGLMLVGMLGKIIPFLVWLRAYGGKVGREPVPKVEALGLPRIKQGALWAYAGAIPLLTAGMWLGLAPLLRAGAWVFAFAAVGYSAHAARVLARLLRPRPALLPAKAAAPDVA